MRGAAFLNGRSGKHASTGRPHIHISVSFTLMVEHDDEIRLHRSVIVLADRWKAGPLKLFTWFTDLIFLGLSS